jgi:hypothetical protein
VESRPPGKSTLGCQIQILFHKVNYTYIREHISQGTGV